MKTKKLKSALAITLLLCMIFSGCRSEKAGWENIYERTGNSLLQLNEKDIASAGKEWVVIGLARSEKLTENLSEKYLQNVEDYVKKVGDDRLDNTKSTDNSRTVLGVRAVGGNPENIGGQNLIKGLLNLEYIKKQGFNGPVWALIALNSGNVSKSLKSDVDAICKNLVDECLSAQCDNGGWGYMPGTPDIDMTAMTLQALAPYTEQNKVKSAAEKALSYLSKNQLSNGGYESYGAESSETCAQVLVALCTMKIDPQKDDRFIKNGNTVLKALCNFATDNGFCHELKMPETNAMSTEQAYYALTAFSRFKSGKTALYDMTK